MWLNEHEQTLRRDLQGLASDLRWSAVELLRIAEQLRLSGNDVDAQAVKLCDLFQGDEQRLSGYAEEVKAKIISRTRLNSGSHAVNKALCTLATSDCVGGLQYRFTGLSESTTGGEGGDRDEPGASRANRRPASSITDRTRIEVGGVGCARHVL